MEQFTFEYVNNSYCNDFIETGYNKGRMDIFNLIIGIVNYISLSEWTVVGRNSSVQSVLQHLTFIIILYIRKDFLLFFKYRR